MSPCAEGKDEMTGEPMAAAPAPRTQPTVSIAVHTLRREYAWSGEARSLRYLRLTLQDTEFELVAGADGIDLHGSPLKLLTDNALRRMGRAGHEVWRGANMLLLKIPTAGQLPMALAASHGFPGRRIVWIDGRVWQPLPPRSLGKLLATQLTLTAGRLTLDRPQWMKLSSGEEADIVVASHTQQQDLAPWLTRGLKVHVIPNGSFSGTPPPRPARDPARPFTVGYLGNGYEVKGTGDLLTALDLVRQRNVPIRARFALSGLEAAELGQEAGRRGHEVVGLVNPQEFFASIDLLALPLWSDAGGMVFPNVLLEALYYGVPVVVSDLQVTREMFGSEQLARFVPARAPEALALALADAARNPASLPQPEALQRHFEANFSEKIVRTAWLSLLRGEAVDG